MPAILVSVATAVTAALNAAPEGTFEKRFTAVRSYADWELPLEKNVEPQDGVFVDVVPVPPLDSELITRGSIGYTPQVDVIVRRRITPDMRDENGRIVIEELDSLVLLVQQLAEYFTADRLATFTDAAWESTETRRSHVPSHLHDKHQFTGIVRVGFTVPQSLA